MQTLFLVLMYIQQCIYSCTIISNISPVRPPWHNKSKYMYPGHEPNLYIIVEKVPRLKFSVLGSSFPKSYLWDQIYLKIHFGHVLGESLQRPSLKDVH
jgi:hypothetical protein